MHRYSIDSQINSGLLVGRLSLQVGFLVFWADLWVVRFGSAIFACDEPTAGIQLDGNPSREQIQRDYAQDRFISPVPI
jgi:hypothetical protein